MKKTLHMLRPALLAGLFASHFTLSHAAWERVLELPGAWGFHVCSKTGALLAADFKTYRDGGIYISEDQGKTWNKTNVKDYTYTRFVEAGDYIFALGYGCRIARSDDGGHTWEVLNYSRTMDGIIAASDLDYTACYAMIEVNGRLYACDYVGGVIYSDDWGETWTHTADDHFVEIVNYEGKGEEKAHQVLYNIETINGRILAFGLECVYEYDAERDKWSTVRFDSNCMSVSVHHNGAIYCGRAIENDDPAAAFLEYTSDAESWKHTTRPEGLVSNYVRSLASADSRLFVGTIRNGVYHSPDDGNTWEAVNTEEMPLQFPGIPGMENYKLAILNLGADKDYLYAAAFASEYEPNTEPGIYRIALSELTLKPEQISTATAEAHCTQAYDLQGRRADWSETSSKQAPGIYVLTNGTRTQKIIIK